MKYLSIDIETTGLDLETSQVLSIGAILEDTENPLPFDEVPKFHGVILRESIAGNLFAINMNSDLLETINQYQTAKDQDEKNDIVNMTGMQFYKECDIVFALKQWVILNEYASWDDVHNDPIKITVAGANFASFDKKFLERLPDWNKLFTIQRRVMDPSMYYIDFKTDDRMPSLLKCKQRAGIEGVVTHNAIEDAWDVVELMRKNYK